MKKATVGNRTYYMWEDNEREARNRVERALSVAEDDIKQILAAIIEAFSHLRVQKAIAWESIAAGIKKVYGEAPPVETLAYDFIVGGVLVTDEPSPSQVKNTNESR